MNPRSGIPATLALITVLIVLMAPAAVGLVIEEPARETYTEVPIIPLKVQSDTSYDRVTYRLDNGTSESCDCVGETQWLEPGQGRHTLTVIGERPDGSTDTGRATFTLDTEPPKITDISPGGDRYDRRPVFNLSAHDTQTGIETVTATANDTVMTVQELDDSRYRLRPQNALEDGQHRLSVTVTDVVGHTATETLAFAIPAAPMIEPFDPPTITPFLRPSITLTVQEPERLDLAASELHVERVSDGSTRRYPFTALDAAETGSTYRLQARPELVDGEHYRLTVHLKDADGHTATETWKTTVDLQPPPVTVSVEPGTHLRGTVELHLTSTDAATDGTVTIGSITRALSFSDGTDTVSVDTAGLSAGETTIRTEVFDTAGNVGISEVSVVIDNMPPRITRTTVARHSTDTAALRIAAEDDAVLSDELAFSTDTGTLARLTVSGQTALFALRGVSGNQVTITVSDRAGNVAKEQLEIPGSRVRQQATFGNRSQDAADEYSVSVKLAHHGRLPAVYAIRRTTLNGTRTIEAFKLAPNSTREAYVNVDVNLPFTLEAVDSVSGAVIAQRTYSADSAESVAVSPTGRITSAAGAVLLVLIFASAVVAWRYRSMFSRSHATRWKNIYAYRRRV